MNPFVRIGLESLDQCLCIFRCRQSDFTLDESMFLQKLVGGNNRQIFPWLLVEECVTLPLGGPPLNGIVFERLHLLTGTLPACQPVILRAPERNHGGHGRFDVVFEGDLHVLFGFERRIE